MMRYKLEADMIQYTANIIHRNEHDNTHNIRHVLVVFFVSDVIYIASCLMRPSEFNFKDLT